MNSEDRLQTKINRSENVTRNVLFGFINRFFSLSIPFVIRTLIIYRFGIEYLGMNSLFASVLQVLNLADFGFGTAIVYSLYRPFAEGDKNTICSYLGTYKRLYRIIGCTILICGILIMPLLQYMVKDTRIPGDLNLYIWYGIFLVDVSVSYLLFGYKTAIPMVLQRNDILSKINTIVLFCKTMVQVVFLLLISNFYFYLLTSLFFTIIRNLLVAWVVKSRFPQYQCSGNISKVQFAELKPKVYGVLISRLRGVSRNGIDSICITFFIGLTMAAIYGNYLCIHNAVISLSVVITTAMLASVGNSVAVESREKNYTDMRRFNFIYMLIAGWASICFLCLYQPFIQLWVGKRLMLGFSEVIALTTYFYVLKMGDMRWVYFEGAGLWWQARYYALAETLMNIFLNIILAKYYGVLGIILATLLSLFFIDFIFSANILFQHYFKNGKLSEFFADHARYFLVTVFIALPCVYICDVVTVNASSILDLLFRFLMCTGFSIFGYYLFYHRTLQYKEAKAWVRSRYGTIRNKRKVL